MKWRFLTRAFVEVLGLPIESVLVTRARPGSMFRVTRWQYGIRYDGALYVEEDDGLAWKRVENA